jgi:hypothetical protein
MSMNRLNKTEPAAFSILSFWAFFKDLFSLFCCIVPDGKHWIVCSDFFIQLYLKSRDLIYSQQFSNVVARISHSLCRVGIIFFIKYMYYCFQKKTKRKRNIHTHIVYIQWLKRTFQGDISLSSNI